MNKGLLLIAIIITGGFFAWFFSFYQPNVKENTTQAPSSTRDTSDPRERTEPFTVIVKKVVIPWSLDFLPDGNIIFTERPGRIRVIDKEGQLVQEPLLTIKEVAHVGEGGLLGIAVHPDFESNGYFYVYYTYRTPVDRRLANKVVRYKIIGKRAILDRAILDNIPGAMIHNGGRIKFGPDGMLYVTTGDAAQPELAQDLTSLAGKILRIKDDGGIPTDNPFPGSLVYSYGHRNPQGLAWDDEGRLWITEHGSRGTDEINLIIPGKNYGWPFIRGDERAPGMESPVIHSGKKTWAPSGATFFNGSLFFVGLRGQTLYELDIKGEKYVLRSYLTKKFGRLRDVVKAPDEHLYLLTSNRDGRGDPTVEDDRIIKVNIKLLKSG